MSFSLVPLVLGNPLFWRRFANSFNLKEENNLLTSSSLHQRVPTLFIKDANVGIAAVHIGGMTVHSFAGIGKGEDGIIDLKKKAKRTKRIYKHWKECRTLIIDEVSMVPPTSLL